MSQFKGKQYSISDTVKRPDGSMSFVSERHAGPWARGDERAQRGVLRAAPLCNSAHDSADLLLGGVGEPLFFACPREPPFGSVER